MKDKDKDKVELSSNAERALVFQYVINQGEFLDSFPDEISMFGFIAGLSEMEVVAAYAELEDKGLIERDG
jgi:hypothetical protein